MLTRLLPLFLLPLTLTADAAPLITCEPDRVFELMAITLFSVLYIPSACVMAGPGFFTRPQPGRMRAITLLIAIAITTSLVESALLGPVRMTPRVDIEAFYAPPAAKEGRHLRDECIVIAKDENGVTLSCRPDAAEVTLSRHDYDSAQKSLQDAERQERAVFQQIHTTHICENQSGSLLGLKLPDDPVLLIPLAAIAGMVCAYLTVMFVAGVLNGISCARRARRKVD